MDQDILRANLEALLFVSEEPQPLQRLLECTDATKEEAQEVLKALQTEYESERFGVELVEIAGGYQICTKPVFADSINKLFERKRKRTLSKQALETLAIIAYKQPITRAEMEIIRGVSVDGAVHTLLERRLVKIAGRKEVPGRPFFYRTTKSFLEYFGLKSLKDLPKVEEIADGLKPLQEHPEVLDQQTPESEQQELWTEMEDESTATVVPESDEQIPNETEPEDEEPDRD